MLRARGDKVAARIDTSAPAREYTSMGEPAQGWESNLTTWALIFARWRHRWMQFVLAAGAAPVSTRLPACSARSPVCSVHLLCLVLGSLR